MTLLWVFFLTIYFFTHLGGNGSVQYKNWGRSRDRDKRFNSYKQLRLHQITGHNANMKHPMLTWYNFIIYSALTTSTEVLNNMLMISSDTGTPEWITLLSYPSLFTIVIFTLYELFITRLFHSYEKIYVYTAQTEMYWSNLSFCPNIL